MEKLVYYLKCNDVYNYFYSCFMILVFMVFSSFVLSCHCHFHWEIMLTCILF